MTANDSPRGLAAVISKVTLRRVAIVVVLTLAWCGLWGNLSVANVLSGLVLSVAVVAAGVGTPGVGGVRILPLIHLGWLVAVDLVRSTVEVAVEVITPTDNTNEAIVAVDLPPSSRHHLLLLTTAITLTPGTAVVDADPDNDRLYLHLLHVDRREAAVANALRLAKVAGEALPAPPDEVAR